MWLASSHSTSIRSILKYFIGGPSSHRGVPSSGNAGCVQSVLRFPLSILIPPAAPWIRTQQQLLLETGCFLCGPCRDAIPKTVGALSSVVSSISQRATAWAQKLMNLHCWELLPSNDYGRL
jgi:hypothetical protein